MKILILLFFLTLPVCYAATSVSAQQQTSFTHSSRSLERKDAKIKEVFYKKYQKMDLETLLKNDKRIKQSLKASRQIKNDGRTHRLELEQSVITDLIKQNLNY